MRYLKIVSLHPLRSIKQTAVWKLGFVSSQNKISDQNTHVSDRKYIYHVLLYVVVIPVKVIEETSLFLF